MADRSVVVRLRAEYGQFVSGVAQASKEMKAFGDSAVTSAAKHRESWDRVGKGMLIAGGVVAVGIGLAIKSAADFDAQMSVVKANIDDKSAPSMQRLAAAALQAGKTTMFSASQAADAENELAKAGLSAADITGGALKGALSLASAGQLDLATAAETAASAMTQFQLSAKDVPHIADLLAAGADKSLGGVTDLAEALKYAGVPAHQFGMSIDETVGILAQFASAGIMGTTAGTGIREMLVKMANPTKGAAIAMKDLGLSFYDAHGQFIGMASVAQELHDKLGGLTQQQKQQTLVTLFGQRAMSEANILMRDGATGVLDWTNKVNDQGFAALQASTKLDNLNGDLLKFKNSLNTAFIGAGQGSQGPLRNLIQDMTGLVNLFSSMPGPIKSVGGSLAVTTATVLLLGGTAVMTATKVGQMKLALTSMGVEAERAGGMLKSFGAMAAAAAVALPLVSAGAERFYNSLGYGATQGDAAAKSLQSWLTTGKASGENARLLNERFNDLGNTINNVFNGGVFHAASAALSKVGTGFGLFGNTATDDSVKFFQTIDSGLSELASNGHAQQAAELFHRLSFEAQAQGVSIDQLATAFPQYAAAISATAAASGQAAPSLADLAKGVVDTKMSAADAAKAVDDLTKALKGLSSDVLTARDAARKYQQSLSDATQAIKDYRNGLIATAEKHGKGKVAAAEWADAQIKAGKALDITTDAGRKNQAALDGIVQATLDSIGANYKHHASVASLVKQVDDARLSFIGVAEKMGYSKAAAGKLADQMHLTAGAVQALVGQEKDVPATVTSTVNVDTQTAAESLASYKRELANLDGKRATTYVDVVTRANVSAAAANAAAKLHAVGSVHPASGGFITGPGTGTSDSIPAMVSNGEFVINAKATAKHMGLLHAINAGRFANGGLVGYASGGAVDFSGIQAIIGNLTVDQARSGVTTATGRVHTIQAEQVKAARALVVAEARLVAVRHARHHTTAQLLAAENAVANTMDRQRSLTGQLAAAEGSLTVARNRLAQASAPMIDRFNRAAGQRNTITAGFIANITTLANRGYVALASELMDMGGSDAEALAAQAVKMPSKAALLQKQFGTSAALASQADMLKTRLSFGMGADGGGANINLTVTKAYTPQELMNAAFGEALWRSA